MAEHAGLRLGSVRGTPVVLMPSWFAVAAAVTVAFTPQASAVLPQLGRGAAGVALAVAVILLASVFVHELAHALAARRLGTAPSRIVLDLWGGHTAFDDELPTPGTGIAVALVGPVSNALIGVAAWGLGTTLDSGIEGYLVTATALSNAFVAGFNALPGLPLDGGRVLEGALWAITGDRGLATVAAAWVGRLIALAIVLWCLGRTLGSGGDGLLSRIWLLLVAWLLWRGAGQALAVGRWRRRMPGVSVAGLQRPAVGLPQTATVGEARRAADEAGVELVVLLDDDGRPRGVLEPALVVTGSPAPAEVPVDTLARRLTDRAVLAPDLAGEELIDTMQAAAHPEYAVLDPGGRVVGVLAWRDVADVVTPR